MKKVATAEELRAQALKRGATLTSPDGSKFNTAKKKAPTVAKRKKPAKVEVQPEPPAPPAPPVPEPVERKPEGPEPGEVLIAEKVDQASKAMAGALRDLKIQISQIQLTSAAPPTEWVFDIIRDERGNLKQIKATASNNGSKTLN